MSSHIVKTDLTIPIPLKIYNYDDFIFLSGDSKHGVFGVVEKVINKNTNQKMVLKKYQSCSSSSYENYDTIKEIQFLRKINRQYSDYAVRLHGIIVENNCIHLVLENLIYTLDELFKEINNLPTFKRNEETKKYFSKILIAVQKIHEMGICHNDLKASNIMLDDHGNIKIIDFGVSDFLGISPSKNLIEVFTSTEFIMAPDEPAVNLGKIGNLQLITPMTNRHSYCSDIYSLGVVFLNCILNSETENFISNGKIIAIKSSSNYTELTYNSKLILESYHPELTDFLSNMLNIDSMKRYSISKLLNHDYLGGWHIPNHKIKNNISIVLKNNLDNLDKLINLSKNYTPYEIINNLWELEYFDEIIKKNDDKFNINKFYGSLKRFNLLKKLLLNFIVNYNLILDNYINCIISLYESLYYITDGNFKQVTKAILLLFTDLTGDYYEINELTQKMLEDERNPGFILEIMSDIIKNKLDYYPVTLHIKYIIINLQKLNTDPYIIYEVERILTKGIIKFISSGDNLSENLYNLRMSEIVQMIYLIEYGEADFLEIDKNNESYDKVKNFMENYEDDDIFESVL